MRGKLATVRCVACGEWRHAARSVARPSVLCPACQVISEARLADLAVRWPHVMTACKLTVRHYGTLYTPRILGLVCRETYDVATVAMIPGQIAADYAPHVGRLAKAFGARTVKILPSEKSPDVLRIVLHHGDPLSKVIAPFPTPAVPDYTALPMARTELGETWALRLFGHQVIGVGATGTGKGSIAWSFLAAVAGGISSGTVQPWGMDPKGGMEFSIGEPLFARLYTDKATEMADAFDELGAIMRDRSQRLRGRVRQHIPTPDEPLIVVLIDELAALTAYADKPIRDRVAASLGLILTQGRALGVHVIALVQDGRKEVVKFRNLFTTRIALHLAEASEVDLVLDDGARDRGALCDQIPDTLPGVGYALTTGQRTPVRVRFSHHSDNDITALAAAYAYPRTGGAK